MAELISNPIRIPCGGFDIDNDTLYFQNDVLKSKREDPELPAVSGIDNGKVLTVAEGSWTAANPATELPSVSATDNGDVLTVVEGAWAKATPSGGVMIVETEVTAGEGTSINVTLKNTWQEIHDALIGKTAVFILISSELAPFLSLYPTHDVMFDESEGVYVVIGGESYVTESSSGYPTTSFSV